MADIELEPGGWYRDGADNLWMDAELMPNGDWRLYRGGSAGPRDYTAQGVYLREHTKSGVQREEAMASYNLVLKVERLAPPPAKPALDI